MHAEAGFAELNLRSILSLLSCSIQRYLNKCFLMFYYLYLVYCCTPLNAPFRGFLLKLLNARPSPAKVYKVKAMKSGSDTISPSFWTPHEKDHCKIGAAERVARPSKTVIEVKRVDS